jgi:hypothetical protein
MVYWKIRVAVPQAYNKSKTEKKLEEIKIINSAL